MVYCKIRINWTWNFFGGCNGTICKVLVTNPQIYRASASTALSVVYDFPMVLSTDDPTVVKTNAFNDTVFRYGNLGNYLVEFFPWMKYIPSSMANWKRIAEEQHKQYSDMFVGLFHEVEDRIVMPAFIPVFVSLTNDVETRGRTPELYRDIDSGTGAPSPE